MNLLKWAVAAAVGGMASTALWAQSEPDTSERAEGRRPLVVLEGRPAYADGVIVKLKQTAAVWAEPLETTLATQDLELGHSYAKIPRVKHLRVKGGTTDGAEGLLRRIKALRASGKFEYVEPDWRVSLRQVPTDARFVDGTLWGLENTGQDGGQAGIDVGAVDAWAVETGSPEVVVGVIDTGIRYSHQDLSANMWTNPGETPGNGVDDDDNGYIDDVYGINAITGSGDPMDDNDHGTHVAGTIAATANGGGGHVGVAYGVRLMGLKFLGADGSGSVSDAIACIEYAIEQEVDILNNSWGGGGYSSALLEAIEAADAAGILFVAAAGNSAEDNDRVESFPANYAARNVVSVAAIDRSGALASFSNFGATSVDIAAPGVSIYSSTSGSNGSYDSFQGTSMAAPHVAGVAALLASHDPGMGLDEMRNRLLLAAEPLASLDGKVAAGGMVDAAAALLAEADGTLELRVASGGGFQAEEPTPVYVTVSDLLPVTGATVTVAVDGGAAVLFRDHGSGADLTAGDGIYSGTVTPAAGASTVALVVEASASGKAPASRSLEYEVVAPPPNDDFADRVVIADGGTQSTGTNLYAGRETGEPQEPTVAGGHTVWWEWTAATTDTVSISTSGSDFDTTLAVYSGSSLSGLSLVAANDDYTGLQSLVRFSAVAGQRYQIQVDGYAGAQGRIELSYPPSGSSAGAPVILTQPGGKSVVVGESFSLSVGVSGASPFTYQWTLDGSPISGATESVFSVPAAGESDEGSYRVEISNAFGSVTSNVAFVAVDQVGLRPPNDNFADATVLDGASGSLGGSNLRATGESGEPDHESSQTPPTSVWYRWTAPEDGMLVVDTVGSDFDTTLAAYVGSGVDALTLLESNDDSEELQSEVVLAVDAGTTYSIAVAGYGGDTGQIRLNYRYSGGGSPENDAFVDAIVLSGTELTVNGDNLGASGESGEPSHGGVANPLASVWWSWTSPTDGEVVIDTFGSSFDTVLAVYSGDSLASLSLVEANDDAGGTTGRQSEVRFPVLAGTTYAIVVDGYGSAEGAVTLNLEYASFDAPSTYTVRFDLGSRGVRTGGGALTQAVFHGEAAVPPEVEVDDGLRLIGWDRAFGEVAGDLTVSARYAGALTLFADDFEAADAGVGQWTGYNGWQGYGDSGTDDIYDPFEDGDQVASLGFYPPQGTFGYSEVCQPLSVGGGLLLFEQELYFVMPANEVYDFFIFTLYNTDLDTIGYLYFDYTEAGVYGGNGAGGDEVLLAYDQAYGLSVLVDLDANTVDIALDGVTLAVGLPLDGEGVPRNLAEFGYGWFYEVSAAGDGYMDVDDLRVSLLTEVAAELGELEVESGGEVLEDGNATLAFGAVAHSESRAQALTLRNTGEAALSGLVMEASGPGSGDFVVESPPVVLEVGAEVSVDLSFEPAFGSGERLATFAIHHDDDGGAPFVLVVSGRTGNPRQLFDHAASAAGWSGAEALPGASPMEDGVSQLLKYAFNLPLDEAGAPILPEHGGAGLPRFSVETDESVFRVEYLRRRDSGLVYAVLFSDSLVPGSFEAFEGDTMVVPIDLDWERVTIERPVDPVTEHRGFARIRVDLP